MKKRVVKCIICGQVESAFSSKAITCKSPKCKYVIRMLSIAKRLKKNPVSILNFMTIVQMIDYYSNMYDVKVKGKRR